MYRIFYNNRLILSAGFPNLTQFFISVILIIVVTVVNIPTMVTIIFTIFVVCLLIFLTL